MSEVSSEFRPRPAIAGRPRHCGAAAGSGKHTDRRVRQLAELRHVSGKPEQSMFSPDVFVPLSAGSRNWRKSFAGCRGALSAL